MAWNTIPAFADGQLVKAPLFQQMLDNVRSLKNSGVQLNTGRTHAVQGVTQSIGATLSKLTSGAFTLEIETARGGDILVYARCRFTFMTLSGDRRVGVTLYVDGVPYQNNNSSTNHTYERSVADFSTFIDAVWIVPGLSPGIHTFELYMRRVTSFTLDMEEFGTNRLVAIEL